MAKPVKGNLDHGNEGRHGCQSDLVASESMWTNLVARITQAVKALAPTKRLPCGGSNGVFRRGGS